jgi:hypothetical protein
VRIDRDAGATVDGADAAVQVTLSWGEGAESDDSGDAADTTTDESAVR